MQKENKIIFTLITYVYSFTFDGFSIKLPMNFDMPLNKRHLLLSFF